MSVVEIVTSVGHFMAEQGVLGRVGLSLPGPVFDQLLAELQQMGTPPPPTPKHRAQTILFAGVANEMCITRLDDYVVQGKGYNA